MDTIKLKNGKTPETLNLLERYFQKEFAIEYLYDLITKANNKTYLRYRNQKENQRIAKAQKHDQLIAIDIMKESSGK